MLLALLLAALPALHWPHPPATAPALKQAGIARVLVPADAVSSWAGTGVEAIGLAKDALAARVGLTAPGLQGVRPDLASATHRPWLDANGWRILRHPRERYAYALPARRAALAAAEAYAYGADAVLTVEPADLDALGRMLSFLASLPVSNLPGVADVLVVDDGAEEIDEVLNLLVRRNILVGTIRKPPADAAAAAAKPIVVRFGTPQYPHSDAEDPEAFAAKMRQAIGDKGRSLRLYGSEIVLARLTGDAQRRRVHLLNYAGRLIDGLRLRLLGDWTVEGLHAAGQPPAPVEDVTRADGATEFTIPLMETYAVVDLKAAR